MPAIITHHLFAEDAEARLPEGIITGEEELLAFLLGNQGPDPLFARFSALPGTAATCHELGTAMHDSHVADALFAMREAVSHLPLDDQGVGRAFTLGILGHYALDSATHPFVQAQQAALCAADPELADYADEVHAIIESDLDTWMLWSQRGLTVKDAPATGNLAHTNRVVRVAGALFAQMSLEVFGIEIGADAYAASVSDYELVYALIDPAPSQRTSLVALIETRLRGKSYLQALAHYVSTDDECAAANLERAPWVDARTGIEHTDTFADVYFDTLDRWPLFAEAYTRGDREAFEALAGGVNYNGEVDEAATRR